MHTASENTTLYASSGSIISVGVSNVYDVESGIASCKVSLTSADVSFAEQLIYEGQVDADVQVDLGKYDLLHGMSYVVVFEAINRAGLSTRAEVLLVLDDSSPLLGIVLGGIGEADVLCHGSTQMIAVEWTRFIDSETTILFHQVAVATTPLDDLGQDLAYFGVPFEPLQAKVELDWKTGGLLQPGDIIYVTVKATNAAGLSCVAVSGPLKIKCASRENLCECSDSLVCL